MKPHIVNRWCIALVLATIAAALGVPLAMAIQRARIAALRSGDI
jgi:ABC-type spermidine/putrescine transport system permease subunit II